MNYSVETTGTAGAALGIIGLVLVLYLLTFGLSVAMYILNSLGMYTIANRRGIHHPWMAWLPVANLWILGSISDQYQYVTRGLVRNRRKVLLALSIAVIALAIVYSTMAFGSLMGVAMRIPQLEQMNEEQALQMLGTSLAGIGIVILAIWVIAVILLVFEYICLHNLYASCTPEFKTLFLVMSIVFPVTYPFFVFGCRKKDDGMPPRKDAQSAAIPEIC